MMSFRMFNDPIWSKLAASIIVSIVAISIQFFEKHEKEKVKQENATYEKQLERLTQVQASINDLAQFVTQQQQQLRKSQETLITLEREKEKLKPIVESDRQIVDAILQLQAEKSKQNVWIERGMGFLIGIVGSLIASVIWTVVQRHSKPSP